MKILQGSKVEFKFEISPVEVSKYLNNAAQEISQDVEVKGFRKGKAPRDVLEGVVGKQMIFEKAGKMAIEKKYDEFVNENNILSVDFPHLQIEKIVEGEPIIVKVEVSVYPDVKLSDYKKIAKELVKNRDKEVTVEEKEIDDAVFNLQGSRAKEISVNREVKTGDLAEVDFEIRLEGVKIEGGDSKNHPVKIGGKKFIPGFEDSIIGMKVGDKKNFKITLPKDYFKKELAGRELEFFVKANNVFEVSLPELNDDFAKSFGKFQTFQELRDSIRDGIKQEKEMKEKEKFRNSLIEKVTKDSTIELPEVMIEKELDKMTEEMKVGIEQHGLDFASYLLNLKKSGDELRKDMRPQAEIRLKASMVIDELAKQEKIEVEDESVVKKANEFLLRYKEASLEENTMDPERLKSYARMVLTNEKVFEFLESQK
ncbi:MAG: trigger factor [Patescibacteria group bacterium]